MIERDIVKKKSTIERDIETKKINDRKRHSKKGNQR